MMQMIRKEQIQGVATRTVKERVQLMFEFLGSLDKLIPTNGIFMSSTSFWNTTDHLSVARRTI